MKFELTTYHRNTPDQDFLDDVRQVASQLKKDTVSHSEYTRLGKYHADTLVNRFGSWNKVLEKANLQIGLALNISNERLFKNVEDVWTKLARQPKAGEMKKPQSEYSISPYINRFGSWRKALESFIEYINQESDEQIEVASVEKHENHPIIIKKRTKRDISDRLRFKILMRDGFTCRTCGAIPLKSPGVELHVDHVLPWSKGGETEPDNLATKCAQCNLGKGNAFNV